MAKLIVHIDQLKQTLFLYTIPDNKGCYAPDKEIIIRLRIPAVERKKAAIII